MIIEDYTLDKKFSDLGAGNCFILHSHYYMKLRIKFYNDYLNKSDAYNSYAVDLETGVAEVIKYDEKVRLIDSKMIIG